MPEGVDSAASAFQRAIDPSTGTAPVQPRDQAGKFVSVTERPEPMFRVRTIEGDPDTGDTSDGGDDPRLVNREREIADGRIDERAERQERADAVQRDAERNRAATDDEHQAAAAEQGEPESDAAGDDEGAAEADAEDAEDEGPQYEITVDGEPQVVSFNELRSGYIREATFHSRMNKVAQHRQAVDQEATRVGQLRDIYVTGLQYLDEDIRGLMPPEPNWDEEYAKDPLAARRKQKQFQELAGKLYQIRQNRAWAIQNAREEQDRQSARYAIDQFTQFVEDHRKLIKDESSLHRIIGGMRKTALAEGFSEQEVAGVYDKRMLNVLLKAYLYDRGMAVQPQAVIPGRGKALIPGSATPIGNAGRRNIDEAQRQLARTGKLEDATGVFLRLLR